MIMIKQSFIKHTVFLTHGNCFFLQTSRKMNTHWSIYQIYGSPYKILLKIVLEGRKLVQERKNTIFPKFFTCDNIEKLFNEHKKTDIDGSEIDVFFKMTRSEVCNFESVNKGGFGFFFSRRFHGRQMGQTFRKETHRGERFWAKNGKIQKRQNRMRI